MKLSTLALGLTLACQSVLALPKIRVPTVEEAAAELEKRASTIAITGVPGATYPRLEIRQMLYNKPNQWTLLILAMQAFHAQPQSSALSYYQIAGIHGVPRQNWDGVGPVSYTHLTLPTKRIV